MGETISNCEASKLGRELSDDLLDRVGDDDLTPEALLLLSDEFGPDKSTDPDESFDFMDCLCSFHCGLMYCCGICGLGGISGEGETGEVLDEPRFRILGLLLRVAPFAFDLSTGGLSILCLSMFCFSVLDRDSVIGEGCMVLDVADFQPFRIDLRALGLSFSDRWALDGGIAGGGVLARGRSENRGLEDGRFGGGFG